MSMAGEDQEKVQRELQNYKHALQRKDDILWTTQQALQETIAERDLLKAQLTHVFKLLSGIHVALHQGEREFVRLELGYPPDRDD